MGNCLLSDEAANDLARIWYYFRRMGAEQVGHRIIARLVDIFELLAEHA